jgi:hypothetical protein
MSTVKNPTFTFDLRQIQVVSFQCNQFFILNHKDIKYGLKIILKYVGVCLHSVFCQGGGGDASLHTARFYEIYNQPPEVDLSFKLWLSE